MITYRKALSLVTKSVIMFSSLFFLASCQDDEFVEIAEDAKTTAASVSASNVGSLTIEGTHTVFSDAVQCGTCSFVVPANTVTVDGKELGLRPGSVICLDAALKYGDVTFTNVHGSEQSPITIGTCR